MTKASSNLLWVQHITFWASITLLNIYVSFSVLPHDVALKRLAIILVLHGSLYVFCYEWLMRVFERKQYTRFYLIAAFVILLSSALRLVAEKHLVAAKLQGGIINHERPLIAVAGVVFSQGMIVLIACLLGIFRNKLLQEQKLAELGRLKVESELALLKARINPHFLLNTLNNIYYYSLQHHINSSDSIIHLSQLLQFTIYETALKRIPLEREMEIIKGLRALYQLRFQDPLDISIEVTIEDTSAIMVPPASILVLFENALKHSALGIVRGARWVHLLVGVYDNHVIINLRNSIARTGQSMPDIYSGLGLKSLKEILAMEYGEAYTLTLKEELDVYEVTLKLPI